MGAHTTEYKIQIIDAARSAFARYGFRKATMADIARKLKITRSALYYYYRNKEEIFIEVVRHELRLYADELTGAIDEAESPEEKLIVFASTSISLRKKFVTMYKLTFEDMLEHYDISSAIKNGVLTLHSSSIAGILRADRCLTGIADIDGVAQLLSMSLRGVVFGSREKNDERLQRDLVHVCMIFYNGLRTMPRDSKKRAL